MDTQPGDDLIERIRMHPDDDAVVGPAANDLLDELYAGYPVENLGRLIHSDHAASVKTGAWLLSELGDRAAPLMTEIPALLDHPLLYVRFFAVEVVLTNADDGAVIARTLNLSQDPEPAVRWKVLRFLAGATVDQLAAGVPHLPTGHIRTLTEWLIRQETEQADPREVIEQLEADDLTTRLFAAAAAARLSGKDPRLLERAADTETEEIRSFALERLRSSR
ncbi:hypothetical protein AB0F17_51230 [Nonomuraea sp. NPDC026600]|uniref:hypothetical protein n=1 Tax=Nonomuraea sp. NPDC026600 TaxID=3155363 RepID=UPI0033CF07C6